MRRPMRSLAVAASAAVLGGALLVSSGSAITTASARVALVHYLRADHPQLELARPGRLANTTNEGSYNWSGYTDTSTTKGKFSSVSGKWSTPAVTCGAEDQIDSDWVGLDGATDGTVEQDGTISWCFEGVPTYFTWYEMYPANTVEVGLSLEPGDSITAKVSRSGTKYTLSVTDATNSANSLSVKAPCARATCLDESAEWV